MKTEIVKSKHEFLILPEAELPHPDEFRATTQWSYEAAFSRHKGLITKTEQQTLRNSRVAIVGMGGVGGIHLVTLARLGIGKFTIADADTFEVANFNRQYGAKTNTLGRRKVEVMAEEARQINPEIEVRIIDEAIRKETTADFLKDADIFVDGIDFFEIAVRRSLFRQAANQGIFSITAGPMGFGAAWLTFAPNGMSFDDYFDLNDNQPKLDQLIAYAIGLSPRLLHLPYLDLGKVNLSKGEGPSSGLACQLCAGITAAETVKILLKKRSIRPVPHYAQFDAYRGILKQGRLWRGNRHPLQKLKRWWMRRKFADQSVKQ